MPNMNWFDLGTHKMGRIAEYYAMLEFASYGCPIYTTEIDEGVDFIAKVGIEFYEIQVKSMTRGKYVYVLKSSMSIHDKKRLVCFLRFTDGASPEVFIIPATSWKRPNAVLKNNVYPDTKKSPPEWGIYYADRNLHLLEKHRSEVFFTRHGL